MRKEPHHTWLKSVSLNPSNVAETLMSSEKRTTEHVTGKFVPLEKKQLQNMWLENFDCRTRDWKILCCRKKRTTEGVAGKFLCRGKKLQNTWLENFGAEGKNCRTHGWKMLVPSEKKTEKHVTGKFWYRQNKKNTWLENWCRRKTSKHVAEEVHLPLRKISVLHQTK